MGRSVAAVAVGCLLFVQGCLGASSEGRIDRHALVTRHNVTITKADPLTPLTVGNGQFAFTADVTGLQSFPEFYEKGIPLGTEAQWGWHALPNPQGYKMADAMNEYEVAGRKVPYAEGTRTGGYSAAANWLRANPHRLHLGLIGLKMTKADGSAVALADVNNVAQTLDLWAGKLTSRFEVDGQKVEVTTICHPMQDVLAIRVDAPQLHEGRLWVRLAFPYGNADWRLATDWAHPDRHKTEVKEQENQADFTRILDADRYGVRAAWSKGYNLKRSGPHEFFFGGPNVTGPLQLVLAFSPAEVTQSATDFQGVTSAAAEYWPKFWGTGGAIDFSQCTDPRAAELERRVVLSQYLTAIQCAGSMPPQETGLTFNSWFGKFHLEMHWWHAAHFALWDRLQLLERSLPWYQTILPKAQATAKLQGYEGARWPKMTSPNGDDSPSEVGVFLIWQQPHPIYYAELAYRGHSDRQTLDKYKDIVFETAKFMASYPIWDEAGQRYVLGPVVIPAQESYGRYRRQTINPTFELAYWHWALETAQQWRQRLGMEREPKWDRVIQHLSKPTIRDGVYTAIETSPYTIRQDHPSMLAALGVLPRTPLIDPNVMNRTLDSVFKDWQWSSTWGWDYPVMAMTAARVGEPQKALDALFLPAEKNRYLANGHNYQSARLPLYLPGNGGLLSAVAMMAAGWDGGPDRKCPGFPNDGKWNVRWEGLKKMP